MIVKYFKLRGNEAVSFTNEFFPSPSEYEAIVVFAHHP